MPEAPTPEMLKRMKVNAPASSNFAQPAPPPRLNGPSSKGKARATTVEDADEEDAGVEDVEPEQLYL